MWGKYCCKSDKEDNVTDPMEGCDGENFSVTSTCCENNDQILCPSEDGCKDNKGLLDEIIDLL